jgi:hypothetical protein
MSVGSSPHLPLPEPGVVVSPGTAAPPVRRATPEPPVARESAPSATADDTFAENAKPELERSFRVSTFLRATPSWLVSAAFHLLLILVLAVATISIPQDSIRHVLVAAASDEVEPLAVEEVLAEIEPMEMAAVAILPLAADAGMADPGDPAASLPANLGEIAAINTAPVSGEIGALFGDEGDGFARNDAGLGDAEFFGVKAGGRKFVFVVDSSRSMSRGKFEAALEELSYAVSKLSKDQYFYVIFFDWNAERMTFPVEPSRPGVLKKAPEPRAVAATPQNIGNLNAWMKTVERELKTDPYEAMRFAVEMLPDAIYLLTDGMFRGKTESYLAENNMIEDSLDGPRPKVVIHTIGFWSDEGQDLLKRISAKYGGTYRFVPPPVKRKKN